MDIPLTTNKKAKVNQEPEVEVMMRARIQVPMSYLTGQEFDDETRPTTDEELWEAIQEDHVYSTDPIENVLAILSDCGIFETTALQSLSITIKES